jgi:outer membrane protein assembly factor BamB
VAVEGRLFESDVNRVLALDAATGRVLFTGNVGPQATLPAVVGATVYVASGSSLAAFPVACAGRCPASWRATLAGGPVAALVGGPGVEALVTLGTDGSLRTYPPDCGASGGDCVPVWTASEGTFTANAPPAIDATGVSAVTTDGTVLRFPLDCAGAASCSPAWTGRGLSGSPNGVAVSSGLVVVTTSGGVAAFGADCAHDGSSCDPLWRATVPSGVAGPPAAGAGVVVVGSGDGTVYAFPLRCDPGPNGCPPAWRSPAGLHLAGPPAIAQGVVFIASDDGRLVAFSTGCVATCHPLWTTTMQRDRVPAGGPVVSGTTVAGVVGDQVVGFTPGGR